ncbi:hypothetical protein BASA81_001254 [Batrachochytrium salamandrivorans]|nr:hypothetical protein BASA81_001254 [Batrachochytrium salamandrivorans]
MLRIASSARRTAVPAARQFSSVGDAGGSWKDQQRAREEAYFNQVNADQRKAFAEKLHAKELRELLQIVGEKHSLTQDQVHKLLEWKHEL